MLGLETPIKLEFYRKDNTLGDRNGETKSTEKRKKKQKRKSIAGFFTIVSQMMYYLGHTMLTLGQTLLSLTYYCSETLRTKPCQTVLLKLKVKAEVMV